MAVKKSEAEVLEIKPIIKRTISVRIVGDTPLIVHKWSKKAKQEMLDKQMKKTKTAARKAKDPFEDFVTSAYWMTDEPTEFTPEAFKAAVENGARWGFPVTSIKQAAIMASSRNETGLKGTALKGSFFFAGEGTDRLAEVKGVVPVMREDMVRVGGISKTADIRYRAEFPVGWYMDLLMDYNANGPFTVEQIINLINLGGFSVGIGEWRPERDGDYGMFHVAAQGEVI